MVELIEANPVMAVAVVGGAGLVLTILFLVLWLVASRGRRTQRVVRVDAELGTLELELSLAEQSSRLRIIRELHELSVHELTRIVGQAEGARYAGSTDPQAAVRAATTIAEAARTTLANLRRVMTIVAEGEADAPPPVRLQSVREMLGVMEEAGLVIAFEESGSPFDLEGGAEVSIYRILQEGLANALDYGGRGTHVSVAFTWTEGGFQLKIDDDGVRAKHRRLADDPAKRAQLEGPDIDDDLAALTGVVTGAGITEMRERTELFGGVFTAVAVPGVGFSISASFPDIRFHNGIHGVQL